MDTKSKGDIGEQAVILKALKLKWAVLRPIGDRLPYDLVFDVDGYLVKIQVKYAWYYEKSQNYLCDTRRTKANRKNIYQERYKKGDFDFAVAYIEEKDVFYVFPFEVFDSFKGVVSMQCQSKRQRAGKAELYFEAWDLIGRRGAHRETCEVESVKVGEASDTVIPSQAQN